jgi:hypothetical protein
MSSVFGYQSILKTTRKTIKLHPVLSSELFDFSCFAAIKIFFCANATGGASSLIGAKNFT